MEKSNKQIRRGDNCKEIEKHVHYLILLALLQNKTIFLTTCLLARTIVRKLRKINTNKGTGGSAHQR